VLNLAVTESQLQPLRKFLDEIPLAFLEEILCDKRTFFSPFTALHTRVKSSLNEPYAFYYSLFRLGHSAAQTHIDRFIPSDILRLLVEVGLLGKNHNDEWNTQGISVICLEGSYFLAPIPPTYPTAQKHHDHPEYFSKSINALIPTGSKNILELAASNCGFSSLLYLRNNKDAKATVYTPGDLHHSLVTISSRLNSISNLSCIRSLDEVQPDYDFVAVNSRLVNGNLEFQSSYDHLESIEALFNKKLLAGSGEAVLQLCLVGGRDSIPGLKELVLKIRNEWGLQSKISVFEKIPAPIFFDESYKQLNMDDWNELAGFNMTHYKSEYEAWTSNFNESMDESIVYRVLWRLSDKFPGTSFATLYKLQNTDPLFALTLNNR
jgi:hypothetical protein